MLPGQGWLVIGVTASTSGGSWWSLEVEKDDWLGN
jgi:hypothetical protein